MTTIDGILNRVIQRPCTRPIAVPVRTAATTATGPGRPIFTLSTAITPAQRPLTMPTVRSISPSSRTNTTPTAIVPTAAICSARLTRLNGLKNVPLEAA